MSKLVYVTLMMEKLMDILKNQNGSFDDYIGQKLRDFREKVGFTLMDLADKVGVSSQQIHKYETGQTKIPIGMLYKLCKIFSITPNSFFEGFKAEENAFLQDDSAIVEDNIHTINVLFIEDNAEDQYLAKKALEEYEPKLNIYFIHDGEEFFNFIKVKANITRIPTPDIIFLDINIPKIDGKLLLKAIKQNQTLHHIPVIILTGSVSRKDVIASYKNQASGYIKKSFEYQTFKENLHLALTYWTKAVILPSQAWT